MGARPTSIARNKQSTLPQEQLFDTHPEVSLDQLIRWIRAYEDPPVAPEPYIAAAREHILEWNEIGRVLCEQFFATASGR